VTITCAQEQREERARDAGRALRATPTPLLTELVPLSEAQKQRDGCISLACCSSRAATHPG
jgi:hypothetical protein